MIRCLTAAAFFLTLTLPLRAADCDLPAETVGARIPESVAAEIAALREHGHRFHLVIELVEAEAARPDWTWAEPCAAAEPATDLASGD